MTMKKLVLATLALAAGTILSFGQGAIIMYSGTTVVVTTNGVAAGGPANTYLFEVLDMTSAAYNALTGNQQAAAYDLLNNSSAFSLWTDTGVSGNNSTLHPGAIAAAAGGVTAANWAQPTANTTYSTASDYDYYTVLGWSGSIGSWATVSSMLANGTFATSATGFFGQTTVAYNYAGVLGGAPGPVSLWAGPTATGLAGSGGLTTGSFALAPVAVPEPTTLAVAGLGGLAMLLIRRRK
jgi:hypothetical protein